MHGRSLCTINCSIIQYANQKDHCASTIEDHDLNINMWQEAQEARGKNESQDVFVRFIFSKVTRPLNACKLIQRTYIITDHQQQYPGNSDEVNSKAVIT